MESQPKNIIFIQKMMMKGGLEKVNWKFLHAGNYFPLLHHSQIDVWISQVRRVKNWNLNVSA